MAREFELNKLCNLLLLSVVHFTAVQVVQSWGVLLGIRGGVVSPGSPNPDPISDQNIVIFHNRFQTWRRQKLCYRCLD